MRGETLTEQPECPFLFSIWHLVRMQKINNYQRLPINDPTNQIFYGFQTSWLTKITLRKRSRVQIPIRMRHDIITCHNPTHPAVDWSLYFDWRILAELMTMPAHYFECWQALGLLLRVIIPRPNLLTASAMTELRWTVRTAESQAMTMYCSHIVVKKFQMNATTATDPALVNFGRLLLVACSQGPCTVYC